MSDVAAVENHSARMPGRTGPGQAPAMQCRGSAIRCPQQRSIHRASNLVVPWHEARHRERPLLRQRFLARFARLRTRARRPRRRHEHLRCRAQSPLVLVLAAGHRLARLAETNSDFLQPVAGTAARHRDHFGCQMRVVAHKFIDQVLRRDKLRLEGIVEPLGNFDLGELVAQELIVGERR